MFVRVEKVASGYIGLYNHLWYVEKTCDLKGKFKYYRLICAGEHIGEYNTIAKALKALLENFDDE